MTGTFWNLSKIVTIFSKVDIPATKWKLWMWPEIFQLRLGTVNLLSTNYITGSLLNWRCLNNPHKGSNETSCCKVSPSASMRTSQRHCTLPVCLKWQQSWTGYTSILKKVVEYTKLACFRRSSRCTCNVYLPRWRAFCPLVLQLSDLEISNKGKHIYNFTETSNHLH